MAEAAKQGARTPEWLARAAVLSVFDLDWIQHDQALDDASEEDLLTFLAESCERVTDAQGTPRWQLRDDERSRVLRSIPVRELAGALRGMMSWARLRSDPVQVALERYLGLSPAAEFEPLDAAELSAALQVARWTGQRADAAQIQARLDQAAVLEPLRRLADGFVGRRDLLAECHEFIDGTSSLSWPTGTFIEGAGGSGKSSVLAKLIVQRADLAVYLSFDRGWLAIGGPLALFDEIVRQTSAQLPTKARAGAASLRDEGQRLSKRSRGWRDIASHSAQASEFVRASLLYRFAELIQPSVSQKKLLVTLDTMEELARRDDSLSASVFGFLAQFHEAVPSTRIIGAGRALPALAHVEGMVWRLDGLGTKDALTLLRRLSKGTPLSDGAQREIVRLTGGNPLSLRLAADVLRRTGEDPARMIAVTEGNVQGQLYSRLLEHIGDDQVKAIAHPGLVVRRITPEIIRDVLAEPCGLEHLTAGEATTIFLKLRAEATLCEPAPEGDGALVHRQDVRAIMLPAIRRDRPATSRAIHEAAARYYAGQPLSAVARREELYHLLMLERSVDVLDNWWNEAAGVELATVIEEFPPRGQVYVSTKVSGLRLVPEILAAARNDEWAEVVRPAALRLMEASQASTALELVQERRDDDGHSLLPDLEVEALERLDRLSEALALTKLERSRAERRVDTDLVRTLITAQARICERMRRLEEAWDLWLSLASLDRARRERTAAFDEDVRLRELIVLTSLLRVARNLRRSGDPQVNHYRAETIALSLGTPRHLLTGNPSLLRDLAAEIGDESAEILALTESALRINPAGSADKAADTPSSTAADYQSASDSVQIHVRDSGLTFAGALRILQRHELPGIVRLDRLLGGVTLTASDEPVGAAAGSERLVTPTMVSAIERWLDGSGTAIGLLAKAIAGLPGKLARTRGWERPDLVVAAHTAIAAEAFFKVLDGPAGKGASVRPALLTNLDPSSGRGLFDAIYWTEVPTPSAIRGFDENRGEVQTWVKGIISPLAAAVLSDSRSPVNAAIAWSDVAVATMSRYRTLFLKLAARVPEYLVWQTLGEAAATRSTIAELRKDLASALDANRGALGRVEALLGVDTRLDAKMPDPQGALARANGKLVEQPIVSPDAHSYDEIEFPTVGEIYVNPRYRLAQLGRSGASPEGPLRSVRPADETWWADKRSRDDFDLMLAAYVTSPDATRLPMLVLGHPGAGKSMLIQVLAARLPATAYTVVRVQLRKAESNTPVRAQIEQALGFATNGTLDSWQRLADLSSATTIRVVLLDGLDELLDSSQADRSRYLLEVMEFQRREDEQGCPVVAVVTSRTVVADRVEIPKGTMVVKLDSFTDADIAFWLARWRLVNATAIRAGRMRALSLDDVGSDGRVRELARLPLMLLMLALYTADPDLPALGRDLAMADLYQRLLQSFCRREAVAQLGPGHPRDNLTLRVRAQLDRLTIAAFAMFNRGQQDVSEAELTADLAALDQSGPMGTAQRTIGGFFFIQVQPTRYEFLHVTFGEYLVAGGVMNQLASTVASQFSHGRRPRPPDDGLLYALLSHQALAARSSTLAFAHDIFARLATADQGQVLALIELLLGGYRHRRGDNRYPDYRPNPPDTVRELACYSANLVALRLTLEPGHRSVPLAKLLRCPAEAAMEQWRSMVMLWKSGVHPGGMQAMLAMMTLSKDLPVIQAGDLRVLRSGRTAEDEVVISNELALARLTNDPGLERRLRHGAAAANGYVYATLGPSWPDTWSDQMASWLIPITAGIDTDYFIRPPEPGTSGQDIRFVAKLIFALFRSRNGEPELIEQLLHLVVHLPLGLDLDIQAIVVAIQSDRQLPERIPELTKLPGFRSAWLGRDQRLDSKPGL